MVKKKEELNELEKEILNNDKSQEEHLATRRQLAHEFLDEVECPKECHTRYVVDKEPFRVWDANLINRIRLWETHRQMKLWPEEQE